MQAVRKESTVVCSGTSRRSEVQTLSERLTPLLISAGLVRGTTLTFGQRLSGRGILAGVLFARDGRVVDIPKQGYMFSRGQDEVREV